jgi:predicted HTH transcriptional regulator
MNYLRETGVAEQLARGIRTIKQELRNAGLQEPLFENIGNSFAATIYHPAFIPRVDRDWLQRFSGLPINERQRTALLKLKNGGVSVGMNNKEYRDYNGMGRIGDDQTANRDLRKLVILGIMEKRGMKRMTRYYIKEKYL